MFHPYVSIEFQKLDCNSLWSNHVYDKSIAHAWSSNHMIDDHPIWSLDTFNELWSSGPKFHVWLYPSLIMSRSRKHVQEFRRCCQNSSKLLWRFHAVLFDFHVMHLYRSCVTVTYFECRSNFVILVQICVCFESYSLIVSIVILLIVESVARA